MNAPTNVKPIKQHCENHEKCMEMIQAVLDGSATAEEINTFNKNIKECMPCIEGHNLEKSIKDALKIKLEKKCCPESTLSKIREKLGMATVMVVFAAFQVTVFRFLFEN